MVYEGFIKDIKAHKKEEEELRVSEEKYRTVSVFDLILLRISTAVMNQRKKEPVAGSLSL